MSFVPAWAEAFLPETISAGPASVMPIDRTWAYGDGSGRGVRVAVVDSGIDATHPAVGAVAGGAVLEPDSDARDGVRLVEEAHGDLYGHGTACAAIIRELAPNVELDLAAHAGIVLVAALNNERKASYPSEFSSVLSVAAMPGQDREQFACNARPPAEWGAPGIDVEVAWSEGTMIRSVGNSFAAPVIAGHAARIVGAHPGITPWQVRTVLAALAMNTS